MQFIHLNLNSLRSKINQSYVAKLKNATGIGSSETKLDNTVLDRKLEIEGDGLVRSDQSRK